MKERVKTDLIVFIVTYIYIVYLNVSFYSYISLLSISFLSLVIAKLIMLAYLYKVKPV